MKSKNIISNKMQEVAVDILLDIIMEEFFGKPAGSDFYQRVMQRYNLQEDPFTRFPCTSKEYEKLKEEYDKQLMMEKYGYVE